GKWPYDLGEDNEIVANICGFDDSGSSTRDPRIIWKCSELAGARPWRVDPSPRGKHNERLSAGLATLPYPRGAGSQRDRRLLCCTRSATRRARLRHDGRSQPEFATAFAVHPAES